MFKETHNPLVAVAAVTGLCLAACAAAWSQEEGGPLSEQDWQTALAAIREVALDKNEAEDHRANAVTAYAKLLLHKKQHDDAMKFCLDVLKSASKTPVIDAALRAGCLLERDRHGHLRAELGFLASKSAAAHGQAASAIRLELNRAIQALDSLAAKEMVPKPVALRFPHWAAAGPGQAPTVLNFGAPAAPTPRWYPPAGKAADVLRVTLPQIQPPAWYRFEPGKLHPALHVTHPKMEPPHWHSRVAFPPLKEPKSK